MEKGSRYSSQHHYKPATPADHGEPGRNLLSLVQFRRTEIDEIKLRTRGLSWSSSG